jgi:hypothetical protein
MSTHKLFKISILVLTVAAIGLVLLPASANAQGKITCIDDGTCALCFDQCQDGVICYGTACSDGSSGGGCVPCTVTQKHPLDFQKGTPHGEQGEKAILAQLLSKDPEVSQALRSLK